MPRVPVTTPLCPTLLPTLQLTVLCCCGCSSSSLSSDTTSGSAAATAAAGTTPAAAMLQGWWRLGRRVKLLGLDPEAWGAAEVRGQR